ncbi:unnamed protein product [Pieris brassicae]|uniref:MADF domain-containing protein n=1 Tax=Pieris brassicae TaxID=7116 RepID=A0A9P0TMA7_PIEBR|nr:unnamed protein product [Pieris brassicae]
MSGNVTWTSENDEQLIDFVKNHEALYNIKSKEYRQAQMKQNLWNEIGITLQKSVRFILALTLCSGLGIKFSVDSESASTKCF